MLAAPDHATVPFQRPTDPLARGRKILVVDDEPAICRFIEHSLRDDGFGNLVFLHNAADVAAMVLRERPRLVILDVMTPAGNGLRTLRALKADTLTRDIPVILISGYDPRVIESCAAEFADAFLPKPFSAGAIVSRVGDLLGA